MSTVHPLTPLLDPASVALIGVSERPGSVGQWLLDTFIRGGFEGDLYLVNPRYDEIAGRRCYRDLADLPGVPEMAVLNVGSERIEALFDTAVGFGITAFTIFDYCIIDDDTAETTLLDRLRSKARQAGVQICGAGGMGYYNLDARVHASYYAADHLVPGHISLLAHSGSVFTVLSMADPRHRFNLVVSAGSEVSTRMDAYLDYALTMPSTRVIAVFAETVRDPDGFVKALQNAAARDVPVVVCKVGKTEQSAAFARTHSGAIAGNHAAFDALLDRYGALRADTLDEMMATAALMSQGRRAGPGGVGAILDSGGLRQLLADLADDAGVPFAELGNATIAAIEEHLPHTLTADNPLDAAGPFTYDFESVFKNCLHSIMRDADTAVGWFEFDATDRFNPVPQHMTTAKSVMQVTEKPFLVVNSSAATLNTRLATELADANIPLINGVAPALVAVRNLLGYRDGRLRAQRALPVTPTGAAVDRWRTRLTSGPQLSEAEALRLLDDFGVPTVASIAADSPRTTEEAARTIGYPVALKTAMPGIDHKADVDGVRLDMTNSEELMDAYSDLSARLGPQVTVAAMAPGGTEVAFGMVRDPQFGPLIMVSAGGTLIELLRDRVTTLAPLGKAEALDVIGKLAILPLLKGARGRAPVDLNALAEALMKFSMLVAALGECISEMDVNPLQANATGVIAVDALVVAASLES